MTMRSKTWDIISKETDLAMPCFYDEPVKDIKQKLAKAIAYLRGRRKYVLENNFVPTSAVGTDIRLTFNDYRKECRDEVIIR